MNIEVLSQEGLSAYQEAIEKDEIIAFDTETESLDCKGDAFMQIGGVAGSAFFVDKRRAHQDLWVDFAKASLSGKRPVLFHNAPFDLMKMRMGLGIRYLGRVHDTRISSHLLQENGSHKLKDLCEARWPGANAEEQAVKKWLKENNKSKPNYDRVPIEIMHPYACQDVVLTRKLHYDICHKVHQPLYDMECELVKVLVDMRVTGVRVDVPYLKGLIGAFESRMQDLESQLHSAAGKVFNVSSSAQVAKILYEHLKIPVKVLTEKGKPSSDKSALVGMKHPVADLLLEHRDKEQSLEFIHSFLDYADENGYVHPSLNQCGTRSGRFSCSDPAAHGIPKRAESAAILRRAFIYPEGTVGGTTDMAQVEMCGFAHYSNDPVMVKALNEGQDLHKTVIVEIGMAPNIEAVTKDQRRLGKGTNFSIVYCVGKGTLSTYLSSDQYAGRYVSPEEANDIRMRYFQRFPTVRNFQAQVSNAVKTRPDHAVKNMFGRMYHLTPDLAYVGVNRIIQGWAGDVMKHAMVEIWKKAQGTDLRLYLNIHDALCWTCKEENFNAHAKMIAGELSKCPFPLRVPLKADTTFSRTNWAEEEPYAAIN